MKLRIVDQCYLYILIDEDWVYVRDVCTSGLEELLGSSFTDNKYSFIDMKIHDTKPTKPAKGVLVEIKFKANKERYEHQYAEVYKKLSGPALYIKNDLLTSEILTALEEIYIETGEDIEEWPDHTFWVTAKPF